MRNQTRAATVVVCTRNRRTELEKCLASLRKMEPAASEIVVVNSAGDDSAREVAATYGVKYVATETPGLSYARNLGAASSSTELIAFIDDDATAKSDWIGQLSAAFDDPKVMVATGTVATPGDKASAYAIPIGEAQQQSVDRETPGWFWLAASGHIGLGGNMMFRHHAFERWPGFDTRLGRGAAIPGSEEHFAVFQLIEMGFRVVHVPGAVVQHPKVESGSRFKVQMIEIAAAYLTLLFAEHPRYRMELLRAVIRRVWRGKSERTAATAVDARVSVFERVRAVVRGIARYRKVRRVVAR
jgi:O-antigen biosynthesis protein